MTRATGWLRLVGVALTAVILVGCVQRPNGPPPDPRQFVLGQTTEAEVIARLGPPQRRSEQVLNLASFKDRPARRLVLASLTYGGAIFQGLTFRGNVPEGGTAFTFRDGTLSGYRTEGFSPPGFAGYDFDKLRDLLANKATVRSDVVALLGDPGSRTLVEGMGAGNTSESDRYVFNVSPGFGASDRIGKTVSITYDGSMHVLSYTMNEVHR